MNQTSPTDSPLVRRMRAADRETPLFGSLPPNLMKVFASTYRVVNEDILTSLVEDLLRDGVGPVGYNRAIAAIREVIEDKHPDLDVQQEADGPQVERCYQLYNGLSAAGWFVERGIGSGRTVDFNPNARLLLNGLMDIKRGLTRSWGGEVLTVLTLIETAIANPGERSEAVRSAHRASRNFQHHLRTLTSHLTEIETRILESADLSAMIGGFFEHFVGRYLIEDYARLKSRTNPFRFREGIVEKATSLREDPVLMEALAQAYHAQGRSESVRKGFETIHRELTEVVEVFSRIDEAVEAVEGASQRLERKFMNMIRYRDRYDDASLDGIVSFARAFLADPRPHDAVIDVPLAVGVDAKVPVPDKEAITRARRKRSERPVIDVAGPDPAFERYVAELRAYQELVRVTPRQAADYLDRAMPDADGSVRVEDLPIASLEDALVISQLRRLAADGDGIVGGRFRVEDAGGVSDTEWITLEGLAVRAIGVDGGDRGARVPEGEGRVLEWA